MDIFTVSRDADVECVRELLTEYHQVLSNGYGADELRDELKSLPAPYAAPEGALILARDATTPAGCVAVCTVSSTTAEIKRLYCRPRFRHAGLGKALLVEALAFAKSRYDIAILDTRPEMLGAQRLYLSVGFREVPSPPGKAAVGVRSYEIDLTSM